MVESNRESLRREILERSPVSQQKLEEYAESKGLKRCLKSREKIVQRLLDHKLTWRDYELELNPPMVSRIESAGFWD